MAKEGLTPEQVKKFYDDGILVVEDFLDPEEVKRLRQACLDLVAKMDPAEHRGTFSTVDEKQRQGKDAYFMESGDKIRYFFEVDSFDENGKLKLPKDKCLNKIGHSLHWDEPNFKETTFSPKMKNVAKSLGLEDPVVVQGMYIFKQPRIGTEVTPHQDGTFLNNDPLKLVGFWFPIDDATLENGCLWYVPGSNRLPVTKRYIRMAPDQPTMTFKGENPKVKDDEWVAAPVKKGSLVLIHGQVMHKSNPNTSEYPRHAYTFHMVETKGCEYSKENWLQPTERLPFPKLLSN